MNAMQQLLTEHMAIWTAADTEKKSGRGRASGNAGSVYGIKKLRELILELAVRGKLVPQNVNDEPASELLKRMQVEKSKLVAEGKIKKEKPLAAIGDDEKPFELPHGWEWARLGCFVLSITSGGTPSKSNSHFWNGNIPWASVKDLNVEKYLETTQDFITKEGLVAGSKLANKGDVIICTRMGLGKIAIAAIDVAINQDLKALKVTALLNVDYFINFYSTLKIVGSGMTVAGIRQDELLDYLVPTPPLAEQHRIVAKVDELMALCDQLEAQHSNAAEAHEKLVSHLLGTLSQSQSADDFSANWQRIAAHFDTLFTTEASIDALKQTLLQLAVMGKLVPQEPSDEPASELLKRIQAEKAKLIAEGKLKKEKPLEPITEEETPYETPTGWCWVRLNELLTKIGAGSTPLGGKQVYVNVGIPFLRSQNVWDDGLRLDDVAFITSETHNKMSGTYVKSGDLLFNITGASIGRCAIVPEDFVTGNVSQHVTIIRLTSNEILRFIHLVLISQHVQQTVMDVQVGVSREGLSIGKLGQFIIPIPPLAEQHRIVTKVDAFMSLCDQLKSRIHQANKQQQLIADALVVQAVAA